MRRGAEGGLSLTKDEHWRGCRSEKEPRDGPSWEGAWAHPRPTKGNAPSDKPSLALRVVAVALPVQQLA